MKEPVDHILRCRLPWRDPNEGALTECGYNAAKVKTITREEFRTRLKDLGQQRTALMTCMTCADTVRRWGTWDDDPRLAMGREVEWEHGGAYWKARTDRGELLKDELLAIAALIKAHREEFDDLLGEAKKRREWLAKKDAMQEKARKPKSPVRII